MIHHFHCVHTISTGSLFSIGITIVIAGSHTGCAASQDGGHHPQFHLFHSFFSLKKYCDTAKVQRILELTNIFKKISTKKADKLFII